MTLEEIRKLRAEATPGKWENVRAGGHPFGIIADINGEAWDITDDSKFIAALPQIADECIRLAEENERLKEMLKSEAVKDFLEDVNSFNEDVKNLIKKRG